MLERIKEIIEKFSRDFTRELYDVATGRRIYNMRRYAPEMDVPEVRKKDYQ